MAFDPKKYAAGAAKFDPKAYATGSKPVEKEDYAGSAAAGTMGLLRGLTMGKSDTDMATAEAAALTGADDALLESINPLVAVPSMAQIQRADPKFQKIYQENIDQQQKLQETFPKASFGGEFVGGALSPTGELVGGALFRGAGAGIKAAGNTVPGQAVKRLFSKVPGKNAARIEALASEAGSVPANLEDEASRVILGEKGNAAAIRAAAEELGAPVLAGQTSSSPLIRQLEDMLQRSPSLVGQSRRKAADTGLDAVRNSLAEGLSAPLDSTPAAVGERLKSSMAAKIREESKPISALYETLRESTQNIPVNEKSLKAISRNVGKLPDARFEGMDSTNIVRTAQKNIGNLKTVDDVKILRSQLRQSLPPTASPAQKAAVANLDRRLKVLEESTVVRAAKSLAKETGDRGLGKQLMSLVDERKAADAQYSGLMDNLRELGGIIKKGKVQGPESFAQLIESVGDEEFARRILAKGNHKQLKFLSETFPDEAQQIFALEKSRIIKQATKDNVVNPRLILKELEDKKLSPEAQEIMFGKDALKKFKAAKTYVESIPGASNPSGTETTRQVYEFFESPVKWASANARDAALLGILKGSEAGDASLINQSYRAVSGAGKKAAASLEPVPRGAAVSSVLDGAEGRRPYRGKERRRQLRLRAMGE